MGILIRELCSRKYHSERLHVVNMSVPARTWSRTEIGKEVGGW